VSECRRAPARKGQGQGHRLRDLAVFPSEAAAAPPPTCRCYRLSATAPGSFRRQRVLFPSRFPYILPLAVYTSGVALTAIPDRRVFQNSHLRQVHPLVRHSPGNAISKPSQSYLSKSHMLEEPPSFSSAFESPSRHSV